MPVPIHYSEHSLDEKLYTGEGEHIFNSGKVKATQAFQGTNVSPLHKSLKIL